MPESGRHGPLDEQAMTDLAELTVAFADLLRTAGIPAGPDGAGRFAAAIRLASPASIDELYWLGRVTLLTQPEDVEVFGRAFDHVFRGLVDMPEGRGAPPVPTSLVAAFTTRAGTVDISLGVVSIEEMAAILQERLADVALGPRISEVGLETMPVFRCRLVLVAAPSHRLARTGRAPLRALAEQTWLVDPDATDPATVVAGLLRRLGVPDDNIRVFPSQAAAWAAAAEGQGVAPAVAHLVAAEVSRRSLVQISTEGMPLELLWHATMLSPDRRGPAADALRRLMATPEATHAMHAATTGVPPSRFRPPVYVTLWS